MAFSKTLSSKCKVCKVNIRKNASRIQCAKCCEWFHAKCSGLNEEEFNETALKITEKNLKWNCDMCKGEISVVLSNDLEDEEEDEHSNITMSNMEKLFKKYFTSFKREMEASQTELKLDIKKLVAENAKFQEENSILRAKVDNLETLVNKLSSNHTNNIHFKADVLIQELNERKKRETRVMVYNIPESTKPEIANKIQDDIQAISQEISEEIKEAVNLKVTRIGRQASGKSRPIIMDVGNTALARSIINTKPKTNSIVRFKHDLTSGQRIHLSKLREELEELNSKGDNNKTIKYINGVPQIVEKRNFQRAAENITINK